jgi:uncharacterized BrkB/YihY/UPF0761 family membrane protein
LYGLRRSGRARAPAGKMVSLFMALLIFIAWCSLMRMKSCNRQWVVRGNRKLWQRKLVKSCVSFTRIYRICDL